MYNFGIETYLHEIKPVCGFGFLDFSQKMDQIGLDV